MAEIHLIGTVHYEPKGTERLENALSLESPDILL